MNTSSRRTTPSATTLFGPALAGCLLLLLPATGTLAQTQNCPETNGVKVVFPPQLDGGWDVKDSRNSIVLADDFPCTSTGPITDIHIWGSWLNDAHGAITNFWLGIYGDVPAATNVFTGKVTPSHPGTNLLWQQSFLPAQFAENPYQTGSEQFYNPTNQTLLGGDTQAWYYCFYPTNPFVQQGSPNFPTNYWLAARAQLAPDGSGSTTLYGWKTTSSPYNDAAVWGTVGANGLPLGDWQSMTNFQQQPINLAFKLTTSTNSVPTNCCPEVSGLKWVQWPDVASGFDIDASQNLSLADDFGCNTTGPITDIRLWGSWLNDVVDAGATFYLSIWSDVPVSPNTTYSHPGTALWQQAFGPGQYGICLYTNYPEPFYTPSPSGLLSSGGSTKLYYLCFTPDPAKVFVQTGTAAAPTNYWLSVSVQTSPAGQFDFGWKTSATNYQDTAVWGNGVAPAFWTAMFDPRTGGKVNMAFKVNTSNPPPPTACAETNGVKYVQLPDASSNGIDVWNSSSFPPGVNDGPWLLADDFVCTNTGPITDIHVWGSWWYDFVATNRATFWLALFEDVPLSATNTAFSYPGKLLWQQCFGPGQYSESFWSPSQETFLDPGPPQIVGTDSQIWYYCFYPSNPPTQFGTASNPHTYWLGVYAQLPVGTGSYFGWKTTPAVQHDISVHTQFNPALCPNLALGAGIPGWTPTYSSGAAPRPLDLAFKLTTPTNQCVVQIGCPNAKTNQCDAPWFFDPPLVGPDPCCPGPPTITLVSNLVSSTPCSQLYSGVWTVTDCMSKVLGVCTQYVTVMDFNPPAFTGCVAAKPAQCDAPWSFDPPTARYVCSGVNVPVGILSTKTNLVDACTTTATRVWGATNQCTGAFATCTEVVSITDTNPPSIVCPTNIIVYTCDTNPVVVTWPTNVASDTCSSVTVNSTPPPGSAFLPNTTNTVTLTARDACGNTNSCGFEVQVRRPVLGPIGVMYVPTNQVVLTWTFGILQSTTNILVPFTDIFGALSPYTNSTVPPPTNQFYRLRCASP